MELLTRIVRAVEIRRDARASRDSSCSTRLGGVADIEWSSLGRRKSARSDTRPAICLRNA